MPLSEKQLGLASARYAEAHAIQPASPTVAAALGMTVDELSRVEISKAVEKEAETKKVSAFELLLDFAGVSEEERKALLDEERRAVRSALGLGPEDEMHLARGIYEKVEIGLIGTCSAAPMDIEAFQDILRQLDTLETAGLIEITDRHRESQSGQRYVDLVRFRRLR
jgi:hypothetical protein